MIASGKKESAKSLRLQTSTPASAITIRAYYGDEEDQAMLKESNTVDYGMEEIEQEVEERAIKQLEEEIETW